MSNFGSDVSSPLESQRKRMKEGIIVNKLEVLNFQIFIN